MITPANYGLLSSVYTSLAGTGLQPGQIQQVPNTPNVKMLVQNNPGGGTLPIGAALKFTSGYASSYEVDETAASAHTDYTLGVNDNAGATIPAGSYFWASIKGFCSPLVATGTSIGQVVDSSAVAATLAPDGTLQTNIVAAAANSSGSPAQTLCYIY